MFSAELHTASNELLPTGKRGSRVVSALASCARRVPSPGRQLEAPCAGTDPYTGSILMHVGSSCKHTGVYNVHLPRIIRN